MSIIIRNVKPSLSIKSFVQGALLLTSAVALLLVPSGCKKEEAHQAALPKATVAQPLIHDVTSYMEFTGNTDVKGVDIKSRVEGHILEVAFNDGDLVNEGQLLYKLDPRPFEVALQKAQAELANNEAKLEAAADDHTRYQTLREEEVVSEAEYSQKRATWLAAEESVAASKAIVEDAKINLGHCEIHAPKTGRIGESVSVGTLVSPNTSTLAIINQYNPMFVYFNMSEQEMLDARKRNSEYQTEEDPAKSANMSKYEVEVGTLKDSDFPFKGHIDFADLGVDSSSGTYQLRAVVQNPTNKILPGQYARVRMPVKTIEDALIVPEKALGLDQSGRFLLIVDKDNVVSRLSVKTGMSAMGWIVIEEGLETDQKVIVDGIQRARPGYPVDAEVIELAFDFPMKDNDPEAADEADESTDDGKAAAEEASDDASDEEAASTEE